MQKKLIALAIAGLSTTAFAQSNVTISGRFSVGVESSSAGGATTVTSPTWTARESSARTSRRGRTIGRAAAAAPGGTAAGRRA